MIMGTRGSKLALIQSEYVKSCLSKITKEKIEIKIIKTTGDKVTNSQLYNMDTKGLFTKELDKTLLDEDVDLVVHSLKDVSVELNDDLEIIAIPKRESPNDVFISKYDWNELKSDDTIGTSSLRREAFCKYHEKDIKLRPLRGNIDTRIEKVMNNEITGTIMAEAGLKRLGLTRYIKNRFSIKDMTPSAGQGALAIICRRDSIKKKSISKLNDFTTFQETLSEKAVLKELGVGCQWPLGSFARANKDKLCLFTILLDKNGKILKSVTLKGFLKDSKAIGREAGRIIGEYI
ncbi:MAG: hydroxymethylbilane synthase [Methanobrevibacter sp.]|nr:hydroxymethylbilane synthase [Candidatus Methanovirga basalitermitum]